MFTHVDEWLGCLDSKMDIALWNCCATWGLFIPNGCVPDAVFEAYTPDDYCARPAELLAFLEIFQLDIVLFEDDPCQPVYLVGRIPSMWVGVDVFQFMYPGGTFAGAPCTQQVFP